MPGYRFEKVSAENPLKYLAVAPFAAHPDVKPLIVGGF